MLYHELAITYRLAIVSSENSYCKLASYMHAANSKLAGKLFECSYMITKLVLKSETHTL